MDVSALLVPRPAPYGVLAGLDARADRARFQVRGPSGAFAPVTWAAFASEIRAVAAWLGARGLEPGDRVAVFAPNSIAWASAALGIQAAGLVLVPVYPATTADQLVHVLGHSKARALFVAGDDQLARVDAVRGRLPALELVATLDGRGGGGLVAWTELVADGGAADRRDADAVERRLAAIELDHAGVLIYTSGTSGNPKGVPLSHRNVAANAADWLTVNAPLLEIGQRDLLWLPMSHIFGFGELCLGNTLGWESFMTSPVDVLSDLPEVAPHVFMSVPAYWEKLAKRVLEWPGTADGAGPAAQVSERRRRALAALTGGRLRFCLSGGAGLGRPVKELLRDAGAIVIEGYGLTETSPTLTLNRIDDYRFDSVGKPLPSVELRLADDGEIEAKGPNVFAGYHEDPVATADAFTADGWFKTGDVGRFTDDGFLQIVDRKKDILVTAGGKNVPPANLEARFVGDEVIDRLVVYGDARPYLVAAVWVHPSVPADERFAAVGARISALNAQVARFETIKRFAIIDEPLTVESGLLTSSLKLKRKAVYQRLADRFEELYA
jgi:long-chain acyl-CoA synthetase